MTTDTTPTTQTEEQAGQAERIANEVNATHQEVLCKGFSLNGIAQRDYRVTVEKV